MDALWQQCIEQFLRQAQQRTGSADTLNMYGWILRKFFASVGKSPEQVTRADIAAFLDTSYDTRRTGTRGPSISTRNQRLVVLKGVYEYAALYDVERDGVLVPLFSGRNPCAGLHAGKPPHVYRAMTGEEIRRFFSVIPNTLLGKRDRALFLTYFYTARRRNEILELRWGDITEGTILDERGHSRCGYTYRFHCKGRPHDQTETAELPTPAYEAIVAYLRACGRYEQMRPSDYVFVAFASHRGKTYTPTERRIGRTAASSAMKRYTRAAGLDGRRLTIHSWRHSSARARREQGSDVVEIKNLLLHSSLDTTFRYVERLTSPADPGASLLERAFHGL